MLMAAAAAFARCSLMKSDAISLVGPGQDRVPKQFEMGTSRNRTDTMFDVSKKGGAHPNTLLGARRSASTMGVCHFIMLLA